MTALFYGTGMVAAPAPTPDPAEGVAAFGAVQQQPAPAPVAPAPASGGGSFGPGYTAPAAAPAPTAAPAPAPAPSYGSLGPGSSNGTGMMTTPGTTPAPTAAPAAPVVNGNWAQEISGLNWAAGEGARSTASLWAIKNKYGLTDDQIAGVIKGSDGNPLWTGAQLGQHFQRYGYQNTGASPGVTGERGADGRITDSPMDPANETIQGRMDALLQTDAQGNYVNPVIRQAVDRQNQAFNARGLRNSSMAMQAAQEAAISKAIEIVGPDADKYFQNRQNNVQAGNQFALKAQDVNAQKDLSNQQFQQNLALKDKDLAGNEAERAYKLRADYLSASDRAMQRYTDTVASINNSQMMPGDKTIAIQQANAVRDADLTYVNNMFAAQPGWQKEWLTVAVPTGDTDITQINNIDTLANIANDPAQSFDRRVAAKARMQQLLAAGPAPSTGSGLINTPQEIGAGV